MQKVSLTALARQQLKLARQAPSGRSAQTIYGGHERALRQTLIALIAGKAMKIQDAPDEATVYVLNGRIRLDTSAASWNGSPGDVLIVPDAKHDIQAVEDSVLLLTVAKTVTAGNTGIGFPQRD